jgi:hypothetical protein
VLLDQVPQWSREPRRGTDRQALDFEPDAEAEHLERWDLERRVGADVVLTPGGSYPVVASARTRFSSRFARMGSIIPWASAFLAFSRRSRASASVTSG